jgi:uncharacterized protein Yka (UPF0111/DUF47 family)
MELSLQEELQERIREVALEARKAARLAEDALGLLNDDNAQAACTTLANVHPLERYVDGTLDAFKRAGIQPAR